jgi:DNA-damage-inducible protein J
MAAQTSMLHVRIDTELREKAMTALDSIGLSASEAVRLLFHRIVAEQAFPLELKVPNATTLEAMREIDEMIRTSKPPRFATADELFEALDRGE